MNCIDAIVMILSDWHDIDVVQSENLTNLLLLDLYQHTSIKSSLWSFKTCGRLGVDKHKSSSTQCNVQKY